MPRGEPTTVISIRLTDEQTKKLTDRAIENDLSIGEVIREIIEADFDPEAVITPLRRERRRKQFLLAVLEKTDRKRWHAILTLWSETTHDDERATAITLLGNDLVIQAERVRR